MEDLNQLKNCLKDHYEYALQSASAQLYFFNSYNLMKGAIKKVTGSSKVFKKEDLTCFDKLTSIEDFAVLLQKLFKPKP